MLPPLEITLQRRPSVSPAKAGVQRVNAITDSSWLSFFNDMTEEGKH
jgi:hypothetical protein